MTLKGKRLLLGITGGVAAYKAAQLARLLVKEGADLRVAMTEAATRVVPSGMGRKVTGLLKAERKTIGKLAHHAKKS